MWYHFVTQHLKRRKNLNTQSGGSLSRPYRPIGSGLPVNWRTGASDQAILWCVGKNNLVRIKEPLGKV